MYVCFEFSSFLWTSYDRALSCDLYQATRITSSDEYRISNNNNNNNNSKLIPRFILLFGYVHVRLSVCCVIGQFHAALAPHIRYQPRATNLGKKKK